LEDNFWKSSARTKLQAHHFLPLQVIMPWKTSLDATVYYAVNFELSCSVVSDLDRDNASSIAILQKMFTD
jgi:hypothetical protein